MKAQDEIKLLDAAVAVGVDKMMYVRDHRHVVVTVVGGGSTNGTVKFAGSNQETPPTATSAQSDSNRYDFLQLKDLEDASTLDGDTGVAFSGSGDVRQFEINTNGMTWLIPRVTAWVAGTISVYGKPFSD